jgi:superfamily II DNA or RNA helicase
MDEIGYIYLRDNAWYKSENTIKLGIASNTKERDGTYVTGEIIRGEFLKVFEIPRDKMRIVEAHLHAVFKDYRDRRGGGTEFFKRDIIDMVGKNITIPFRELSPEECDMIKRETRYRNVCRNEDRIEPRHFQKEIIAKCAEHFSSSNKGLLVLTCGVGKTLISLWIAQRLCSNKIAIGVPTVVLLEQWIQVIAQVFPDRPILQVPCNEDVAMFVTNNPKCVVITTYSSSHKLIGCLFDMKILDETHHLTSKNIDESSSRAFVRMLDIESAKQLALTATPKHLEGNETNMISNDNREQFGEIIHRINLLWAIDNNVVCDYVIQTIVVDEGKISDAIENKRLFLAAYCALKSILTGSSHHLLIYCNDMNNSTVILGYVSALLKNEFSALSSDCFAETYTSKIKPEEQTDILAKFEATRFGIIICVYCLGEGWNCPLLDAVVFAENMSSNIRISQCAQRACRKDYRNPDKIAKIILPILDMDVEDNADLKTVREVIYQMGLEDATVISKLKVFQEDPTPKPKPTSKHETHALDFVYDEEMTKRLRLKTTPRTSIGFELTRKLLAEKNIRSIDQYLELCDRDIRFPRDPEQTFRHLVSRWSWIHYLGISSTFYEFGACKQKCQEYLAAYPDIRTKYLDLSMVCAELCQLDPLFPPLGLWVDYYGVNELRDIIQITTPVLKKKGLNS